MAGRPIERAVLEKFSSPGKAAAVLKDGDLTQALQSYQDNLRRAGLLPDAAVFNARLKRLLLGLAALGVVGVTKIQIGLRSNWGCSGPPAYLRSLVMSATTITLTRRTFETHG